MPTARLVRQFREQVFAPSNGQTVFTLAKPIVPIGGLVSLYVNGLAYTRGIDFTVSGVTLNWLNTPFVLATVDCVVVVYDHI